MRRLVGAFVVAGSVPAWAAPRPVPATGFDVYAPDDAGGGWVIHHLPGRGATLWGCKDIATFDTCTQVMFDAWRAGASMSMLHVAADSGAAWFKLSVVGDGDFLYACTSPEGAAACTPIELELRMKGAPTLDRVWPPRACVRGCGADDVLAADDPRAFVEPAAKGEILVELGPRLPGPSNLYACKGLGTAPACQLVVPNWLGVDRENLGFKKLEDKVTEGADGDRVVGPGAVVGKIDEDGAAYEAGLREGDVITRVGPFEVDDARHATNLMLQYPALAAIPITREDGSTVVVTPRRKPASGR